MKTEECEKLKIEIKDFKQLLELKNSIEEVEENDIQKKKDDEESNDFQEEGQTKKNPWVENSRKQRMRNSRANLPSGNSKHEEQYNCKECDYQGTSNIQLKKHIELKHTARLAKGTNIECRICGERFDTKWKFMSHSKDKHITSVAY